MVAFFFILFFSYFTLAFSFAIFDGVNQSDPSPVILLGGRFYSKGKGMWRIFFKAQEKEVPTRATRQNENG